jgi:hypothetical protein
MQIANKGKTTQGMGCHTGVPNLMMRRTELVILFYSQHGSTFVKFSFAGASHRRSRYVMCMEWNCVKRSDKGGTKNP